VLDFAKKIVIVTVALNEQVLMPPMDKA